MNSIKLALDCAADVLGVDASQIASEPDDGPVEVLCAVWDAMIDANREEEDDVFQTCVAVVYGAFFVDRAPTMTDVLAAGARGVDEEFLKLMCARATDVPSSIHDWVKTIPGLEYVDDSPEKMEHPNRLGQMQNAVWALESELGYRYWPSGDGCNFDFLIDLFHRHYTDWLSALSPDVIPEMDKMLTPLLTASENYFAQRLKSRYGEVYRAA